MSDITRDYSFGGWLRSFRIKREITIRGMCQRNGLNAGNYSKLERSRFDPPNTISRIKEITEPLKLDEAELNILIDTAYSFHLAKFKTGFEK